MIAVLSILGGFVLLLVGGEALVRGSVAVATRLGVSKLVIGLTLVGFGTSAPELVTSLQAALADSPGIAIGNVVGSNIANILLILGLAAVIAPVACAPQALTRDGSVMVGATLVLLGFSAYGFIPRWGGVLLLVLLALYLGYTLWKERQSKDAAGEVMEHEAEEVTPANLSMPRNIILTLVGFAGIMGGAKLLVDGSVDLAREAGISETIIGLTIVAVGTSLPELVTSVMAAIKRHGDVALGNVIGSNIFNILGILGITALIKPIPIPPEIMALDMWVALATVAVLMVFAWTGRALVRWEGGLLVAAYGGYLAVLAGSAAG